MKKIFTKLLAVVLVCLFAVSGFNFSVVASNTTNTGETLSAMNIEISGKISLMLYFTDMDQVSYFQVTVPNKEGSSPESTTDKVEKTALKKDSTGRYLLKIPLPAAQQADVIQVQAFNESGVGSSTIHEVSVVQYANLLFAAADKDSEKYGAAATAVRAMLNYGAMAQTYFNHNTANLANADLYYRGTNPVDNMTYEDLYGIASSTDPSTQGNGEIAFSAVNAYLEDTVSLRFYFEYSGSADPESLTVKIDGTEYPNQVLKDDNGKYYVLINNIPSTLFNEKYCVNISDGSSSAEVEYSVLNYVQERLAKSGDENFLNVGYSLFQFYTATNAYKGNNVIDSTFKEAHRCGERTYIVNNTSKPILCSDCGEISGYSGWFEVNGETVTAHYSDTDASGNFISNSITYTASGLTGYDEDKGLLVGSGLTITNINLPNLENHNRFFLNYFATQPVEIAVTYTDSVTTTTQTTVVVSTRANFTKPWVQGTPSESTVDETVGTSKTDKFYLEAGEGIFSAVYENFLANFFNDTEDTATTTTSPANISVTVKEKTETTVQHFYEYLNTTAISSIVVTPLTSDDTYFVMFNYDAEAVSLDEDGVTEHTYINSSDKTISAQMVYAENDFYKLGISLSWGGTITELYDLDASATGFSKDVNLVNNYDTGRLIQQSYYGTFGESGDGYEARYYTVLAGSPSKWNYNPVQAGDEAQNASRLIDYEKGYDYLGNPYIYIKVQPYDWACEEVVEWTTVNGQKVPSATNYTQNKTFSDGRPTYCYVENYYTVADEYVQVDNRLVDFSPYKHHVTSQELPAFYTLSALDKFYWYDGTNPWTWNENAADPKDADGIIGTLTGKTQVPFWGYSEYADETTFAFKQSNTETWGAWVDSSTNYGIGLYIPHIDKIIGGQSETKGFKQVTAADGTVSTVVADVGEGTWSYTTETTKSAASETSYFMASKSLKIVPFVPVEYSYLICAGDISNIRQTFKDNKDFATNYSLNENSVSKRLPDTEIDMREIDFTLEENLSYLQNANQLFPSYASNTEGIKLLVDGIDPYFYIDYAMFDTEYIAGDYNCIEFEYKIEPDLVNGSTVSAGMFFKFKADSEKTFYYHSVSLIADGEYHVAKIYTKDIISWTAGTALDWIRLDFIEAGAAGQVMYLKSFNLTDKVSPWNGLNVAFSPSSLAAQVTDGYGEDYRTGTAPFTTTLGDGYLTITKNLGDGVYDGVNNNAAFDPAAYFTVRTNYSSTVANDSMDTNNATGQYLVIKYRTDSATLNGFNIYASTSAYAASKASELLSTAYVVADGEWHITYIDLNDITDVNADTTDGQYYIKFFRLDITDPMAVGETLDIAYIGLCDADGLKQVSADHKYAIIEDNHSYVYNIDVISNGTTAFVSQVTNKYNSQTVLSSDYNITTNSNGIINVAGWMGFTNTNTIAGLYYNVIDENGNYSGWKQLSALQNPSDEVKTAVQNNLGTGAQARYSNVQINLSDYQGQKVKVVIGAPFVDSLVVGGLSAQMILAFDVTVASNPDGMKYSINGSGIASAAASNLDKQQDAEGNAVITGTGAADAFIYFINNTSNWHLTGKYLVITYKTDAADASICVMANTTSGTLGDGSITAKTTNGMLISDGEWHNLVVDLTQFASYTEGEAVSQIRLDCCENVTSSITIKTLGLCNDLSGLDDGLFAMKFDHTSDQFGRTHSNLSVLKELSCNAQVYNLTGWATASYNIGNIAYTVVGDGNEWVSCMSNKYRSGEDAFEAYYNAGNTTASALGYEMTEVALYDFNLDLSQYKSGDTVTVYIAIFPEGLSNVCLIIQNLVLTIN